MSDRRGKGPVLGRADVGLWFGTSVQIGGGLYSRSGFPAPINAPRPKVLTFATLGHVDVWLPASVILSVPWFLEASTLRYIIPQQLSVARYFQNNETRMPLG